jgi:GT2 family glycosyltransferase
VKAPDAVRIGRFKRVIRMSTETPETSDAASLRVVIGIATRGRPAILRETLADLEHQTHPAAKTLVAYLGADDITGLPEEFPAVTFILGSGGSCAQRNHLIRAAGTLYDLVLFLDDDFYLHPEYLSRLCQAFADDPRALGATGQVIADGAKGPGLTVEHARALLAAVKQAPSLREQPATRAFNTYGCNMAFRVAALQQYGVCFDEQLPAYGWYEDLDMSRQLLPYGHLLAIPGAMGVHLGVKVGRTSGRRLGYSQVANPMYLARKGSYPWGRASRSVARNFVANAFRSVWPEPYIDRRGRLKGNLLALADGIRGRMHPKRIETMQ